MATYTPPPYFPQGQLSPADPNRHRKFKFIVAALILVVLLILAGVGVAAFYLIRAIF